MKRSCSASMLGIATSLFSKNAKTIGGLLLVSAFGWSSLSHAVPVAVNCPGASPDGNRQGQLTTDPIGATCLDYGYGNIGQGNPLQDDFLQGNGELGVTGALDGWSLVSNGDGLLGLPKSINGIDWTGFSRLALFFKVGGGQYCPTGLICTGPPGDRTGESRDGLDWFVFELPTNETSATFQVLNNNVGGGGLSHWGVYGIEGSTSVPAPGTLGLLGLGLAGIGVIRRRKR